MMHEVTASARKGGAKKSASGGKVRGMHIRRADNGFITRVEREPEKGDMPFGPDEEQVHETPEAMHAHVAKIFGIGGGKKEDPKHEKAEPKSLEKDEHAGKGKTEEEAAGQEDD
jgi:hypothetical protein